MSTTRSIAESEGDYDAYDELYEDWYLHTDNDSSSSLPLLSTSRNLAYIMIKRQTYPHWEKDALKDHVVARLRRGRNEQRDDDSKSNSNASINSDVDHTPATSRIRVTDSAALSAQSAEREANNIDSNARAAPSPASPAITSTRSFSSSSSQLCVPSPDHPSLFASFAPPHLPPATHFPPLDPRAQLLLERSKEEARHRHQQQQQEQQQQQQGIVLTFSFSRLQTMVADSANRERSSVLNHLAGLHNQVQGPPQSPSLWKSALEDDAEELSYGLNSPRRSDGDIDDLEETESTTVSTKATENGSEASTDYGWPLKKEERLVDIKHAFDDSFIPDCRSSTFSGSIINDEDEGSDRVASRSSKHGFGFTSRSEYTCGHQRHYVHPVQDTGGDDSRSAGRDFSFYFRSESRQAGRNMHGSSLSEQDHDRPQSREFTDTNIAMEDYAGSDRSTRANASLNGSSIFGLLPDTRTSSELYLSPNFPDANDRVDYFTGGVVVYSALDSGSGSDEGAGRGANEMSEDGRDGNEDSHRVYFPTQSAQATGSSAPFSTLRRLATATRRRVSSVGGAALGLAASVGRKQSQSQSQSQTLAQPPSGPNRPTTKRSAPSAKAELEKSERQRPRRDTTATAASTTSSARQRNVLIKRGRSSTVRPVGFRRSTFHSCPATALGVPNVPDGPDGTARTTDLKKREPEVTQAAETRTDTTRTGGRFSFIRRLSHLARPSNSNTSSTSTPGKATESSATESRSKLDPASIESSEKPEPSPTAPQSQNAPPSPSQVNGEELASRTRARSRGAAVLLRHFSLASPRAPGSRG